MTVTYAVPGRLRVVLAAACVAAVVTALLLDGPGAVLFGIFAAGLLVEAARALLPTLVADEAGCRVLVGPRYVHCPWASVEAVRTVASRRTRRPVAVELDLGDRLVVVAGYRLGVPAEVVAERLTSACRSARPRR